MTRPTNTTDPNPWARTPGDAVEVLNRINTADPTVLPALIARRVLCNEDVANDPTVQVGELKSVCDGRTGTGKPATLYEVGFLGVLNGIFGIDERTGFGPITAQLNGDGTIDRFETTDFDSLPDRKA